MIELPPMKSTPEMQRVFIESVWAAYRRRRFAPHEKQRATQAEYCEHCGYCYVQLFAEDGEMVLDIYRLEKDGQMKRMSRWPRSLIGYS